MNEAICAAGAPPGFDVAATPHFQRRIDEAVAGVAVADGDMVAAMGAHADAAERKHPGFGCRDANRLAQRRPVDHAVEIGRIFNHDMRHRGVSRSSSLRISLTC